MAKVKKEQVSHTAELLRKVILTKLTAMSSKSFDQKSVPEFSLTFRVFVMKYLRLNYEFTDEELPKELDSKNIKEALKGRIIRLSKKLEEIKYAERKISKTEFEGILREGIGIVDTATKPEGEESYTFIPEKLKRKDPRHLGFYSRLKGALFGARKHHEGPQGSSKRLKKIDNMIKIVREKEASLKAKKKRIEKEKHAGQFDDEQSSKKKERVLRFDIERRIIGTGVDGLVKLVEDKGKVTLADVSRDLEISHDIIEEWVNVLSEQGIITVSRAGVDTILISRKVAQEEGIVDQAAQSKKTSSESEKSGLIGRVKSRLQGKKANGKVEENEEVGAEDMPHQETEKIEETAEIPAESREEESSAGQPSGIKKDEIDEKQEGGGLNSDSALRETVPMESSKNPEKTEIESEKFVAAVSGKTEKSKTNEDEGAQISEMGNEQSQISEPESPIKLQETELESGKGEDIKPEGSETEVQQSKTYTLQGDKTEANQEDALKNISEEENQIIESKYQKSLSETEEKQENPEDGQREDETDVKKEAEPESHAKSGPNIKKDVKKEKKSEKEDAPGSPTPGEHENIKNEQSSEYYQQVHALIRVVDKKLSENDLASAKQAYDEMRAHYTQLGRDEKKKTYQELLKLYSKLQSKMKKWEIA